MVIDMDMLDGVSAAGHFNFYEERVAGGASEFGINVLL